MIQLTIPLKDRLAQLASNARNRAEATPAGPKREALLRAARLSENALHIQQWLSSPVYAARLKKRERPQRGRQRRRPYSLGWSSILLASNSQAAAAS
jgi:hypothetical protein